MRKIGTINIKIGLVNIPLSVNSFLDYEGISFKQLCPNCESPINYKRVCPSCNREIAYNELKSGFQISKSNLVVIDKEALKLLDIETRVMGIIPKDSEYEFITEKCYLLTPHKDIPKSYFLLRNILLSDGIELVIEFSLRKKLNLGIIKPINLFGKWYLMLKQILYSDKIKEIEPFNEESITEQELQIGRELFKVVAKTLPNQKYEDIKDKRVELLTQILEGKIKPKEVEVRKAQDLMEQLKRSVESEKKKLEKKEEKKEVEE